LRYHRSRFFTFLFFMQKLSRNSSGKIKNVVVLFTRSPTKLGLHFSEFATIFYRFYKNQQNPCTIEDSTCNKVPGKIWGLTIIPLLCGLALKKKSPLAIGPLGTGRRRSGRTPANLQPGSAGRGRGTVYGFLGLYSLVRTGQREDR
jgi:hypothetical protein